MRRSLKYLVFAGSGVLSSAVAYQRKSTRGSEAGVVYAAGAPTEVLHSGLTKSTEEWNWNWDFREPTSVNSPRKFSSDKRVPSLAEHFGGEQTPSVSKPTSTRHLVFIRHGQYVKADKDEGRNLTHLGRYVLNV